MQDSDIPLMAPLSGSIQHLFVDLATELQSLKERTPSVIGNAPIVMGPISSRPNTAGLAAAVGGGDDDLLKVNSPSKAPTSAGAMSQNTNGTGLDGTSSIPPSTAQSSTNNKKVVSQQSNKSGVVLAVPASATEELFPAGLPLETPRQAAGALQNLLSGAGGADATDPWLQAAEVVAQNEEQFLTATKPSLEWAQARSAFFNEKDAKSYWIEDVLGEWVADRCPPPEAYTIDAIALAKDHTQRLESTYGYKIPRGLHEVGKVIPTPYDKPQMLSTLTQHDPAGATVTPEFVCRDTIVKNEELAASHAVMMKEPVPPTSVNPRIASMKQSAKRNGDNNISGAAAPTTNTTTMLKASLQRAQLECNMKSVDLRAQPGAVTEVVLQLWNVSAYSLRIKIAPSPWDRLIVEPVHAAAYDPETPLGPGASLEVRVSFHPMEVSQSPLRVDTIKFGYTRDLNQIRVNELTSLTQQWSFLEIPVSCLTILPAPTLLPEDNSSSSASSPLLLTEFPAIFAQTRFSKVRTLLNRGCRSVFAISTSNAAFEVSPASVELGFNETAEFCIDFCPTFEGEYNGTLDIVAYPDAGSGTDASVASLTGILKGVGVIPRIAFESAEHVQEEALATSVVSFVDEDLATTTSSPSFTPALVMLDDAAVQHPSRVSIVIRNDCILPLPFEWIVERAQCSVRLSPASGVLPPKARFSCDVLVTPTSSHDVASGLLSLFLRDMPKDCNAGAGEAGAWTRRQRLIPQLQVPETSCALVDPFGLFSQAGGGLDLSTSTSSDAPTISTCIVEVAQTTPHLFAGAIRIAADPKPLRVTVTPSVIQSHVECLTQHCNDRTFILTNHSPRPVHYWLDPKPDANHPGAQLSEKDTLAKKKFERHMRETFGQDWVAPSQRQRDDCQLVFTPQCGTLDGNSTLEVRCKMTLLRLGHHVIDVECYVAELGREASPTVTLIADAVGPSLNVSQSLLDFGVIAVGDEAEARFTVTNHNPVNVSFCIQDPLPCDPPRFVFLPTEGHLHPGKSMDITVYRQGIIDERPQCYIEVVVREGGTTAVECRASVQQPAATITPSRLDLGEVDCAIPKESEVALTNLSSVDIPFTMHIVELPPTMTLLIPDRGVLLAGQHRAPIKLKAQFNGTKPDVAIVSLMSQKLTEPVLFAVTCSLVRPMSVALTTTTLRGDEAPLQSSLSMERYLSEVLWNLITTQVIKDPNGTLFPHCPSIEIPFAELPTDDPFCAVQTRLRVDNRSGCISRCAVVGSQLVPLMSPFRAPASSKLAEAQRVATPPPVDRLETTTNSSSMHSMARKTSHNRKHSDSGASSSVSQRIMKLKPDMPSYECKAIDGREDVEFARKNLREYAQSLLIDGRGCALQLSNTTGFLKPHGSHEVIATLIANLPGEYHETLRVACEGVPSVELNMHMTVRGQAILIDPTTSGLATTESGVQRLTLPSVVAGMNKARRRMRISNRCPRDIEVEVMLNSVAATFLAVFDGDNRQVNLVSASSSQQSNAGGLDGQPSSPPAAASVSPTNFILPAMGSHELVVEFAPVAGMSGEWNASLFIRSRIAKTEYNDVFLLDEFYLKNASKYPSTRAVTATSLVTGGGGGNSNDSVRTIPKLNVQLPLVDRERVVKDNVILQPSPTEQLILDMYHKQLQSASFRKGSMQSLKTPMAADKPTTTAGRHVDDSDDEDDASSNDVRAIGKMDGIDKDLLLRLEREREELKAYIAARREEMYTNLVPYLTPTSVMVVGVIMPALLACDPPQMLRFPMCRAGENTSRAIRLTNPTRTPLDFRVAVGGPFKIVRLDFIPADGDEDVLEEDDEEGVTARRQLAATLRQGGSVAKGLANLTLGGSAKTSLLGSIKRTDPNSDPVNTLFHLRPRDAVDLTVELHALSTTQLLHKHKIEGGLTINFQGCTLTQEIPCLATVHTPSITCDPAQTWFRPPVLVHDGKPQPVYPRTITLINNSACDATFKVMYVARIDAPPGSAGGNGSGGETIRRLKKVQQVLQVSPLEEHAQLLDDPSRFTISPQEGVVPAATVGGAPGQRTIQIVFHEYSYAKYECKYRVDVEGGVGSEFVVRGDSRDVEI